MRTLAVAMVAAAISAAFVSSFFYFGSSNPFVPFTITQTQNITRTLIQTQSIIGNITRTQTAISTSIITVTTFVNGTGITQVCFTPKGGCADTLITMIDKSTKSVHAMVYSFTNPEITKSLIRAKQRGIDIKIVLDNEQSGVNGNQLSALKSGGIEVRIDKRSGLMHNKIAIIDGSTVVSGSYNWTDNAENSNRENMVILKDINIARRYEQNFQVTWDASTRA